MDSAVDLVGSACSFVCRSVPRIGLIDRRTTPASAMPSPEAGDYAARIQSVESGLVASLLRTLHADMIATRAREPTIAPHELLTAAQAALATVTRVYRAHPHKPPPPRGLPTAHTITTQLGQQSFAAPDYLRLMVDLSQVDAIDRQRMMPTLGASKQTHNLALAAAQAAMRSAQK